jgi:hypothetical protein
VYSSVFKVMLLVTALCFLAGCGSHYSKVNFCWTSDYHLDPDSRLIEIDKPLPDVEKKLLEWVQSHGGQLNEDKSMEGNVITVTDENRENFRIAHAIAKNEWASYQENDYNKRPSEEDFKKMTKSIRATKTLTDKSTVTKVSAIFSDKDREISYKRNTGEIDWAKSLTVGLLANQPIYKMENKQLIISSVVEFLLFDSNGKTKVYATGRPIDMNTKIQADFGKSIGHKWWRMVTGTEESLLVMDALNTIK